MTRHTPGSPSLASPIDVYLDRLRARMRDIRDGTLATYIPELAGADPDAFGMAVYTLDGTCYATGEFDIGFTIQSMSKPFTYGQALARHGRDAVLRKVGVEPTGEAFNSIILDERNNRPFNPMVNAGAIAVANLLAGPGAKTRMVELFSDLAGRPLTVDEAVYRSEKDTGHRNRAIAYLMLNAGMIDNDPEEVLDLYFRQCSLTVTCSDMALMAATLANMGQNPVTGKRVYAADQVQDVLTLMNTCGMYDYAGQWAYEVGIPAKSGVAGGIFAVIPGQAGVAIWSPPLDAFGNSVRGVEACREISASFGLHGFAQGTHPRTVIRRGFHAGAIGSTRVRSAAAWSWLADHGQALWVLELQGALHFAAMETVLRDLTDRAELLREILIDLSHAGSLERPAARMLVQGLQTFANRGLRVTLSGLGQGPEADLLSDEIAREGLPTAIFDDLDSALEAAEDRLLLTYHDSTDMTRYALRDLALFAGLTPQEHRALETVIRPHTYADGERIVARGEPVKAIHLVASGQAEERAAQRDGRVRRLSAVGPGESFGASALGGDDLAHADIHAKGPTLCYVLALSDLHALGESHPGLLRAILSNIVTALSNRLRQANEDILSLH